MYHVIHKSYDELESTSSSAYRVVCSLCVQDKTSEIYQYRPTGIGVSTLCFSNIEWWYQIIRESNIDNKKIIFMAFIVAVFDWDCLATVTVDIVRATCLTKLYADPISVAVRQTVSSRRAVPTICMSYKS